MFEKTFQKRYHRPMLFESHSVEDTQKLAAEMAKKISSGPTSLKLRRASVIALEGELGAGKTTFVQAFAQALGVEIPVRSPTFVLMKKYNLEAKLPSSSGYHMLYHIDCYRLRDENDLLPLGIEKVLTDPENIVLIEWAERVAKILPADRITVHIDHVGPTQRRIEILNPKH